MAETKNSPLHIDTQHMTQLLTIPNQKKLNIQPTAPQPINPNQLTSQEEIPDHFYDSDLASVNEKDFLSDNQPPKDCIQQRKLLFKQKKMHVYKTIVKLGIGLDKPARYDKIKLKFKQVPQATIEAYPLKKDKQAEYLHPEYFSSHYLMAVEEVSYNVGKQFEEIERFVVSMKRGQLAVFEIEHLQVSKKSNIKLRERIQVFVVETFDWLTVIDMDCDGKYMKEVHLKGEGYSRINKHDQVSFEYSIIRDGQVCVSERHEQQVKLENKYLQSIPNIIWKLLENMKNKEMVQLTINDQTFKQCQQGKYTHLNPQTTTVYSWTITLSILHFYSIDDIFMDGRLLKKLINKGVSSAKPDSSSLIYYALQFVNAEKEILFRDACFNSDWWEDLSKLDELNCRKNYLDDYSMSQMLKQAIKRMKPAQVAQIECRDASLFASGLDYQEYKQHHSLQVIPGVIRLNIRVYNFTQGRNCFNMELQQKIEESKRKKKIGIKLLKENHINKALKIFQTIVSYYGSGNINQQAYDQKISSLMNSILCHIRLQNFVEVVRLCDLVLELPRHGYDINKLKIKGPMIAKIQGQVPQEPSDQRQLAQLHQNETIINKCLYRKGLGLINMGEGAKALQILDGISVQWQQVIQLRVEGSRLKTQYQKKSVKMFKNMFG